MAGKMKVKNKDREICLYSKIWNCDPCEGYQAQEDWEILGVFLLHERPGQFSAETRRFGLDNCSRRIL